MPTAIASLPPPFAAQPRDADPSPADAGPATAPWGKDGFGFDDLLDIINPLQHIPVISSIYRSITGDEISYASRMIGGAVYGGVLGVIAEGVATAVEQETGATPGDHVAAALMGMFRDDEGPAVQHASAAPAPPPSPPAASKEDRIASTIHAAQAAQLPLLLASLGLPTPETNGQDAAAGSPQTGATDETARPRAAEASPAKPTPFELMRRALDKYERMQAERRQGGVDVRS